MAVLKRVWAIGLVMVLVALLVGPATAVEPRATTYSITLAPGAFYPTNDDLSYDNAGFELAVKHPSASGSFMAPILLPERDVKIRKIVLYAYDNGSADVCLSLYRVTPADAGDDMMARACSSGTGAGIQPFSGTATIRPLLSRHGAYLYLYLPGLYSSGYGFYGAKVFYSY
jgi:hypothetical protein